ncbi:MAG: YggS family pyridoxal phosphate-dependent enzyme [Bacteroidales bacterium]|nr:YggS family pyridoxal phosphate-dependent enzyme [Bacteroidales bacterium]
MNIAENINKIKSEIPDSVTLVAVSKTKPYADIMEAYNSGLRVFGENRVQELVDKRPQLPSDISWHMIGHLQTNKVKYIAGFVDMIHAVDSLKLLNTIEKEASRHNREIDVLLQFHIAKEETKYGFTIEKVNEIIDDEVLCNLQHVKICGVMGMATFTDDASLIRSEFRYLKDCFDLLKAGIFNDISYFTEISMGMSGDYLIAIEEGSTNIRVGSSIFGERNSCTR